MRCGIVDGEALSKIVSAMKALERKKKEWKRKEKGKKRKSKSGKSPPRTADRVEISTEVKH